MTSVSRVKRAATGRPPELDAVLKEILKSLSLLMIDADLPMREFEAIAKASFVDAASTLARRRRGTINQSSVSAITGLSRAEVKTLLAASAREKNRDTRSRARRVIDGWTSDQRFQSHGVPRILPTKGRGPTFETLVRLYGADTPPRALLDRLIGLKLVRVMPKRQDAPACVALTRVSQRRRVQPVLLDIAKQMSRALARRDSVSTPTITTERISVKDARTLPVLEQIVAERTAIFLSSLRSLGNALGPNHASLEVFVGTSSSGSDRTRLRPESKSNHATQKTR